MEGKLRVGVIFGGKSGEHEVSLVSARSIMAALDPAKFEVVPIGISKEGEWLIAGDPMKALLERATNGHKLSSPSDPVPENTLEEHSVPEVTVRGSRVPALAVLPPAGKIDVVFPVLHGTNGEDGTIQGLFEMANVPYVGAGVLSSALGMDKPLMKAVFEQAGLPIAKWQTIIRQKWERERDTIITEIEKRFVYPCFVKPANGGSSVGISKAHSREELESAIDLAAAYDRKVLVEEAINCREIECSVLGNENPEASVLGEIIPHKEFYDYEAKYKDESTQLVIPAELPKSITREIQDLAVKAFLALDCAGMARVDFFVDRESNDIYVNELNTIPGFTAVSMYPKLWEVSGLSYSKLVERLIFLALERHADKQKSKTTYNGY